MNCRRGVSICLLVFCGLVGYVAADEPLSVTFEMRHGKTGPKKAMVAVPGEIIHFAVTVVGLKPNDSGRLKYKFSAELRAQENELLNSFPEYEDETKSILGVSRLTFRGGVQVPEDYAGEVIRKVCVVRDLNSNSEVKQEFEIKIDKPTSPFPYQLSFGYSDEKGAPASGKFTVGDSVLLRFQVGEIKNAKSIHCKCEIFRGGESVAFYEEQHDTEVPRSFRTRNNAPLFFEFRADAPVDGFVRVTITDESKNSNSVDLPLSVTEALGAEDATLIAKNPKKSTDEPKKE